MEQNLNNNEVPQVIENDSSSQTPHRALPIFLIFAALSIFMSTAAILFFNYQYSSRADYKDPNNNTQRILKKAPAAKVQITPTAVTPTPANQEEATINSIIIDDGSSDFSTLDETASGL